MVPLNALGYTLILFSLESNARIRMHTHIYTHPYIIHIHTYMKDCYIRPHSHYAPDPVESPCRPSSSAGFPPGTKHPPTTFKLLSFARQIAIGMVRGEAPALPYLSIVVTYSLDFKVYTEKCTVIIPIFRYHVLSLVPIFNPS